MSKVPLPRIVDMINPTLQALRRLGSAGTKDEIRDVVAQIMDLNDAQLQATFTRQGKEYSRVNNVVDWAKVYLSATGYIELLDSGLWALTNKGRLRELVDPQEIITRAQELHRR